MDTEYAVEYYYDLIEEASKYSHMDVRARWLGIDDPEFEVTYKLRKYKFRVGPRSPKQHIENIVRENS